MTESTPTTSTERIVVLGHAQYGGTYAQVTIEGEVFFRDADGVFFRACRRCGGTGSKPEFGHVYAGECFGCCWTGRERGYADEKTARKAVLRKHAREARSAAKRAVEAAAALAVSRERDHAEALRMDAQRDKRAAAALASRYAGEVGSKVRVTGVVRVAMTTESMYGSKRFVILEGTGDDAGITLKMAGTSAVLWDVDKDDELTVAGTVKEHDVREGVRQTVVIRAKEA